MFRSRLAFVVPCLLVVAPALSAQETKRERARFPSRDGVELYADYYPGKGRKMPTVLCVPDKGESRRSLMWRRLGEYLEQKGYNVLVLDLRGSGDSPEVDAQEFWHPRYPNRQLTRGKLGDAIAEDQFDRRYEPMLINDLAAAKAFLDRKNDQGNCNSSNLVVIGAGRGATLAAVWMHAEWCRYRVAPPVFAGQQGQISNTAEGTSIMAAVLLGPEPTLGGASLHLPGQLELAAQKNKMPLSLLYATDDEEGARLAKSIERHLKKNTELPYTTTAGVDKAGKRSGAALLDKHLGTPKAIWEYLETVREAKAREWLEHEFRRNNYVWRLPTQWMRPIVANQMGDMTLYFDTYERFVVRR